jgi:hypothetical protein
VQGISTSSITLVAWSAVPDTGSASLHGGLSAELAHVLGVLRDFHLLHLLTERGTITGSVLSDDSDLLRSLGLRRGKREKKEKRVRYLNLDTKKRTLLKLNCTETKTKTKKQQHTHTRAHTLPPSLSLSQTSLVPSLLPSLLVTRYQRRTPACVHTPPPKRLKQAKQRRYFFLDSRFHATEGSNFEHN